MANTPRIRIASAVLLCVGLSSPGAILAAPAALPGDPITELRDPASIPGGVQATPRPFSARGFQSAVERYRSGDRDALVRYFSSPQPGAVSSKTVTIPSAVHVGLTQLSITDSDNDGDGTTDQRKTTYVNFDAQRRAVRILTSDLDLDLGVEAKTLDLFEYDSRGNLTKKISEIDSDADEIVDSRTTITAVYDARGRALSQVREVDAPAGGSVELVQTDTLEYDQQGHEVKHVATSAGEVSERNVTVTSYDQKGQMVTQEQEFDHDDNGTIETRILYSYAYDQRGNELEYLVETDEGDDGALDRIVRSTSEYDSQSRRVRNVYETDGDANGTVDEQTVYTTTYDAQGRPLLTTSENENYRTSIETTYDAQGRVIHSVATYDPASPGAPSQVNVMDYTYDARGNGVSLVTTWDNDDDGVIDSRSEIVSQYNARGDVTEEVFTQDFDADGTADYRVISAWGYDSRGEVTTASTKVDNDADGAFESTVTTTIRYTRGVAAEIPVAGTTQPTLRLRAAGPNPFQDGSSFGFSLPAEGNAELRIFDASGRLVRDLMSGSQSAGDHQVSWDGRDDQARQVPSGAYFAQLRAAGQVTTRMLFRAR